jgi:hypothetical protein
VTEASCARRIVTTLARRAYRRPLEPSEVDGLVGFYKEGRRTGGSFDAGVEFALRRVLASPSFVFRPEKEPETVALGTPYRIGEYELASRLSFFLWSSIPDDELLRVAATGTLSKPEILRTQVTRMLADPEVVGARGELRRTVAAAQESPRHHAQSRNVPRL